MTRRTGSYCSGSISTILIPGVTLSFLNNGNDQQSRGTLVQLRDGELQMKGLSRSVVSVAMLLLCGCVFRPVDSDMTGNWVLTNRSRRHFVSRLEGLTPTLRLQSNGRFEAVDFPIEMTSFARKPDSGTVSAQGTWRLVAGFFDADVRLVLQSVDGRSAEFGQRLFIHGTRSGSILRYFRDIDAAIMLEFEKRP